MKDKILYRKLNFQQKRENTRYGVSIVSENLSPYTISVDLDSTHFFVAIIRALGLGHFANPGKIQACVTNRI